MGRMNREKIVVTVKRHTRTVKLLGITDNAWFSFLIFQFGSQYGWVLWHGSDANGSTWLSAWFFQTFGSFSCRIFTDNFHHLKWWLFHYFCITATPISDAYWKTDNRICKHNQHTLQLDIELRHGACGKTKSITSRRCSHENRRSWPSEIFKYAGQTVERTRKRAIL